MNGTIVETAKAKVNLALHVLGRRDDGYHDIDSAVAFADVGDVLTVRAVAKSGAAISASGPFAAAVPLNSDNLICRAHALLSEYLPLPGVAVHLEKNLPVAAGIGGGSADAAAALRAFIRLAASPVEQGVLIDIALKLGADVPVCLRQQASRMGGIGEALSALPRLPAPAIVLANPGVPCETAAVFAAMGLARGQSFRSGMDADDPATWRNDMTDAAIAVQPVIAGVLQMLGQTTGLYAVRMSGSGATCFGLAESLAVAQRAAAHIKAKRPNWWVAASGLS